MTLHKIAIVPKKCDKCCRTFIFEKYNIFYKFVGIENYPLKCVKCDKCMKRE